MNKIIYEGNTLKIAVTVVDEDGAAVNLTTATMDTYFGKLGGQGYEGTVEAVDLSSGEVYISFDTTATKAPEGNAQLVVTMSGQTQTVYDEKITVKKSVTA